MHARKSYDVIIGSYGTANEPTINWLTFYPTEGEFREIAHYKGVENPSYLTLNKNRTGLYVISEVEEGMIHSFHIDRQTKTIAHLNAKSTQGAPCYVTLDADERYVLSANYGGGSVVSHHLKKDGSLGTPSKPIVHGNTHSNKPSHIHTIRQVPHTDYYIATDLGCDKLYVLTFSKNGQIQLVRTIDVESASGPRHICFHPTKNRMYVVSEFKSCVFTFSYNNNLSDIHCVQVSPTLPKQFKGENFGADIHMTSEGKFLFTSNRGHHSLTTFRISPDGMIDPIAYTPSGGEWPRNFIILPDSPYIIVLNEHTDNIVGMKMDANGELQHITAPFTIPKPVCIQTF